jgi:hypothetical protein
MATLIENKTPGQIIAKYQSSSPVDVIAIAQELGLNVWSFSSMPEGISGKIFRDPLNGGFSGFSVGVNAHDTQRRQRFTVAHEIAHFILHKDRLESGDLVEDSLYRSGMGGQEESEANRLAADILMPYPLIQKLASAGDKTPEALADHLAVSLAAIKIRLGLTV